MKIILAAIAAFTLAGPVLAQPALKGPLADLSFLVGDWRSDDGKVADTGQTSVGTSHITIEADGAALLRRDRTDLTNPDGRAAGGFSQVMLVHAGAGSLAAEYVDGEGHVIRYDKVEASPGHAVFTSAAAAGQPTFRLSYELKGADTLDVDFGMLPPGASVPRPIAHGVLHRVK